MYSNVKCKKCSIVNLNVYNGIFFDAVFYMHNNVDVDKYSSVNADIFVGTVFYM
jgi:hypothetical protein